MASIYGKYTWGCDWTWRQGPCPATDLEADGFQFVKLKAGGAIREGWSFVDPFFSQNAQRVLQTGMVPGAYWYLMPEKPHAQAGILLDLLLETGSLHSRSGEAPARDYRSGWAVWLDVENPGLTWDYVLAFALSWQEMSAGYPLALYTRKSFWEPNIDVPVGLMSWFVALEEAHWVPATVRADPAKPYATQQALSIEEAWWNPDYAGWPRARMLQFTDNALAGGPNGRRTCATVFNGKPSDLRSLLTR